MVADGSIKERVVVLGAGGFVGRAAAAALLARGYEVDAVSRSQIDLTDVSQAPALTKILAGAKAVVFASAVTPDVARVAGGDPTPGNLAMAATMAACGASCPDLQIVYLSSDAVYGMRDGLFSEESVVKPDDAYGEMHLTREQHMQAVWPRTTSILRLSQVYGPGDTHNAYGPCRFVRQALAGELVQIFGEGEDARDHIWIDDVTAAISMVVDQKFYGLLCVSSGMSPTFHAVSEIVAANVEGVSITQLPRTLPAVSKRFSNERLVKLGVKPISVEAGVPHLVGELRR